MDMTARASATVEAILALAPDIAARADEIEQGRAVPADLSNRLQDAGAYQMLIPRAWGGAELNLIQVSDVLEGLGKADASTAWSVMITLAFNVLAGMFPKPFVEELFKGGQMPLMRGGAVPISVAAPVEGGFRIKGKSPLSSGSFEHQWVMGHAVIVREGAGKDHAGGPPETRLFLAPREQTEILPTWDSVGLCGSSSDDIAIHEQFVPERRTTTLAAATVFDTVPHRLGVLVAIPPDHASVAVGIARGALDDLVALSKSKRPAHGAGKLLLDDPVFAHRLGDLAVRLNAARAFLRSSILENWEFGLTGQPLTPDRIANTAAMSAYVQNQCVDIVQDIFAMAGTTACYRSSTIQRRWRDIRCLGQHIVARTTSYQQVAHLLVA